MPLRIKTDAEIEQVVERYAGMITRVAWQHLGSKADAEDVMQDVFVRLMAQDAFENEAHLRAWLIRVAINRCKDINKSGWRSKTVPLADEWPGAAQGMDETLAEVMRLRPNDRTVLYLYYYEGYTIAELAVILGQNPNTVNSRLARARKKLRAVLQPEQEGTQHAG